MDVFGPANTDTGELRVLNEELAARLRQPNADGPKDLSISRSARS